MLNGNLFMNFPRIKKYHFNCTFANMECIHGCIGFIVLSNILRRIKNTGIETTNRVHKYSVVRNVIKMKAKQ